MRGLRGRAPTGLSRPRVHLGTRARSTRGAQREREAGEAWRMHTDTAPRDCDSLTARGAGTARESLNQQASG